MCKNCKGFAASLIGGKEIFCAKKMKVVEKGDKKKQCFERGKYEIGTVRAKDVRR